MMAGMRRSPQAVDCVENPADPACGPATRAVFTSTALQGENAAAPTQTAAEPTAVVVTSIVMNNDGSSYTLLSTATPSTVAVEPTTFTAPVYTEPPQATAASKSSGGSSVSPGAVAGIAIGTCIVGAAIAFVAAWLLFKRRDRKFVEKTCPSGYPIYADSSPELVMVQKSAAADIPYAQVSHKQMQMRTPVPVPSRAPALTPQAASDILAGVLPPSASESEVQSRVAALFAQIHRHVDTYYRDVHASITPSMDADLAAFGHDVDMLALLQECAQPTLALKHALTAFVLGVTDPGSSHAAAQSVWPAELACVGSQVPSSTVADSAALATAHALHRRLAVYLYTHAHTSPPTYSASRLSNTSMLSLSLPSPLSASLLAAAELFSLTFFPWANPLLGDQEREGDLARILAEALECRIWLCGQVGEWGVEWEDVGRRAVVVRPAVRVREAEGRPWRVVCEQGVVGM